MLDRAVEIVRILVVVAFQEHRKVRGLGRCICHVAKSQAAEYLGLRGIEEVVVELIARFTERTIGDLGKWVTDRTLLARHAGNVVGGRDDPQAPFRARA